MPGLVIAVPQASSGSGSVVLLDLVSVSAASLGESCRVADDISGTLDEEKVLV